MKNTVKLVFYNHPQRCDNISHTFLKRQITITIQFFVTTNLPTCEKFVNISILFYSWGVIEKLFQKLVSKQSKTIKALGLRLRTFISFLVFGNPDDTPALIFEIIHERFFPHMISLIIQYTSVSCRSSVPFRFKHDLKH